MAEILSIIKERAEEVSISICYYTNIRCCINVLQILVSVMSVALSSAFLGDVIPSNVFQYLILSIALVNTLISIVQTRFPFASKLKRLKNIKDRLEMLLIKYTEESRLETIKIYEQLNIELSKISDDSPPQTPSSV